MPIMHRGMMDVESENIIAPPCAFKSKSEKAEDVTSPRLNAFSPKSFAAQAN